MQQLQTRTWTPSIGDKVSLPSHSAYCEAGIPNWHWMTVLGIDGLNVAVQNVNNGELATIPVSLIQAPIGWKERYTITTTADRIPEVLGWLTDGCGITVRQSSYMPECVTAFQPSDNNDVSHWKFAGNTVVERIPADQCDELFQVVKLEQEWDVSVPAPCKYCVEGKRTRENNPVLVGHETRCQCGAIAGFSFDEPYHPVPSSDHGHYYQTGDVKVVDSSQCAYVRSAAECWVCDGTGIGCLYLSEIPRKERNKVIAAMHADGWKVTYRRGGENGGSWVRERETVVKRFGQTVPAMEVK